MESDQRVNQERQRLDQAIRHKRNFMILEDVPIGICDNCGARYFAATVLRRVAEIGRGAASPLRTIEVPVGAYAPNGFYLADG